MTSNLKRTTMVCALAASVLLTGRVTAQRQSIPPADREAQAVLIAAYPELREGRFAWRLEATSTGAVLEAREAVTPVDVSASQTAPTIAATVTVDAEGRLADVQVRGTLLDRARSRSAGAGTGARDVEGDLRAIGAKFPPGEPTVTDGLVPAGLQRHLAAHLVRETRFRAEAPANAPQDALTWQVELETDDRAARPYTLVFEPVEGRLVSVVRR
jgi:hypothetical protein